MEHKIEIGGRVRLKKYRDLPDEYQHSGPAKNAGKKGEIVDIMWSNAKQREIYKIWVDGAVKASSIEYTIDCFDIIPTGATYGFEIDVLEDRVNVVFCEYKDESRTELSRSYGHLLEDGTAGIAQAASFAMFRLYNDIAGNRRER